MERLWRLFQKEGHRSVEHILEGYLISVRTVAGGSSHWFFSQKVDEVTICIDRLKRKDFRVRGLVGATPASRTFLLHVIMITQIT